MPESSASTDPRRRSRSTGIASSSTRPKAITPSTASIPRSAPTRTRNWRSRSARELRANWVASGWTPTSGRASRDFMRPATWWSASTRSAMPWAKAGSPRRRSATISRGTRAGARAPRKWNRRKAALRPGIRGRGRCARPRESAMPSRNGISDRRPSGNLHLEKVARTEILDRHDSAHALSVTIDAGQGRPGRHDNIRPLRAGAGRADRLRPVAAKGLDG